MSDLHLEISPGFRISSDQVRAPYLILAGDIGDPASTEYAAFLVSCSELFSLVFVVLGNHEAYGKSLDGCIKTVEKILENIPRNNVKLLNRGAYEIRTPDNQTLRVLGCTLWSKIDRERDSFISRFMNDFHMIKDFVHHGAPGYDAAHKTDLEWLEDQIRTAKVPCLVVTHHAPRHEGTSHPMYTTSKLASAFATDLPHLLSNPPVLAWIHGHTHFSHVSRVPSQDGYLTLTANQRCYPAEINEFDPVRCLDI